MEKFKITIPKMALVKTSLSTHYSNSHHLQFMFNVHALVKAVDKLKLHLTDELLKSWAGCKCHLACRANGRARPPA